MELILRIVSCSCPGKHTILFSRDNCIVAEIVWSKRRLGGWVTRRGGAAGRERGWRGRRVSQGDYSLLTTVSEPQEKENITRVAAKVNSLSQE